MNAVPPTLTFEDEDVEEEERELSTLVASAEETPAESPPAPVESVAEQAAEPEPALGVFAPAEITREASTGGSAALIISGSVITVAALGVVGFRLYKKRRVAA